ncbi:TPA: Tn3 family transposase [Legionella pneumophila]
MSSIEKTAYPRFPKRKKIKQDELNRSYSLGQDEVNIIKLAAKTDKSRFNMAIQLKTFQRLGYFIEIDKIPSEIVVHIRQSLKYHYQLTPGYGVNNKSIYRHRQKIREFLKVTRWGYEEIDGRKVHLGLKLAIQYAYDASHSMNNIPDIINVVIEKLVHASYELPSFYKLNRLVRHTRHTVNNRIFSETMKSIIATNQSEVFKQLLILQDATQRTLFDKIKNLPKRPTIDRFQNYLDHFHWLMSFGNVMHCLDGIAKVKIEQFAEEANQLTADELNDCNEAKRYTLIASLLYRSQANAKDAIAVMFCRLISIAHKQSKNELVAKLSNSKEDTCNIVELFKSIMNDGQSMGEPAEFAKAFYKKIEESGGFSKLTNKCDDILASHSNEYRIYLSDMIQKRRSLLFKILKALQLNSPTQDDKLILAMQYLLDHENRRAEFITEDIDLSFTTAFWKKQIMGGKGKAQIKRRELESCVFEYVSKGLNSGDLYVKGARNYADYRAELMPWDECQEHLETFCDEVGIANNPKDMMGNLKKTLADKAQYVDQNYFNIPDFVINEDGRPVLKKYEPKPKSEHAEKIENLIRSRMPERSLLDILTNGHHHTTWAVEFGPIAGTEGKLENAIEKYILTNFCYGTSLGPTQTAKHVRFEIEPRTLSRINKKHFSLRSLNKAITRVIDCLNQFPLLRAWGTGQRVAVDGTLEDIHDDNLIAEQHIRYGRKGGIAYRHIADNYIALFSTFIQCGVWEAIHIIDGLLKNASEVQPNIVHSDTQGQSLPVFAFAYLLGIQLMPRIRNWKDLNLYRVDKKVRYINIDSMFCEAEIDWDLLETHWQDLMQVIISVKLGKVSSSFILSKLNSYNNQNRLYKAFQELGKVIRTTFLLDYVSNKNLRQTITATTNKVESYHTLEDWIRFGSRYLVASNDPDEMEKAVKHTDLIANCIMLQNVIDITDIYHALIQEGYTITEEDLSHMSPYITEQIKRFGEYVLDLTRRPANLQATRNKFLFKVRDEELESVA